MTTFLFVPESPVRSPGRVNWIGASIMSAWLVTGLLAVSYGPIWGWKSATVLGLFAATAVLIPCWIRSEIALGHPDGRHDDDADPRRVEHQPGRPAVRVRDVRHVHHRAPVRPDPDRVGYGFGASVTQSGLYLLPFAVAMLVIAPLTGRLTVAIGSKPILIMGALFAAASYGLLAVAHGEPWNIYVAAGLLGIGVAFGFASMSNLIVEAVPPSQTGVATGMNTNVRNIGAALGSGVATSLIVSGALVHGYPKEHGYVLAFVVCGGALVVAAIAALMIPTRSRPSVVLSESHPALTAEAEVIVGAIGYVAED